LFSRVFEDEDRPMLEAVQANMGERPLVARAGDVVRAVDRQSAALSGARARTATPRLRLARENASIVRALGRNNARAALVVRARSTAGPQITCQFLRNQVRDRGLH